MTSAQLREEAAGWFSLRRSGDMTRAERAAFDAWTAASPAAQAAYRQIERTWELVGSVASDPEIAASRLEERQRYIRPARWRGYAAALSAIAATFLLVATPATILPHLPDALSSRAGAVLTTGPGQRTTTTLADGSVVTLDVSSRLRVVEMGARRRIELVAGHAFFRVAKDALHPFLVTAMDKTVHAIGTAFDVRIEGKSVAVTLVEGKVRVDEPRGLFRAPVVADMVPGRQLVAAPDRAWTQQSVDTARVTSWLGEKLIYLPDTLGKLVADINAGSPRKIVFVGPVDAQREVIGVFSPGDVEAVVAALEMNDIAHVVARKEDRIEMAERAPAPPAPSVGP